MRERLLHSLANLVVTRPRKILIVVAFISLIMGLLASQLNLELSWVGLAPDGDPSVVEYQEILNNFPAVDNIFITVESQGPTGVEEAARITAARLRTITKYVHSVNYKIDQEFALDNGLLLYDSADLGKVAHLFSDSNLTAYLSNLNDTFETEYVGGNSRIAEDEEMLVSSLRGLDYFLTTSTEIIQTEEGFEELPSAIERMLVGDPFFRSNDGKTLLLMVRPTYSVMDYQKVEAGAAAIESELEDLKAELPGVSFGLTGMHILCRDELVVTTQDSNRAMLIGGILVLALLIIAFKMWLSPLLAFVPLLVGIIWALGLSAVTVGRLNLITAFTAAILIGLGIDFSIHILSGFTEARGNGYSPSEASFYTLEEVGPGIITGALTTAAAFFTLTLSSLGFLRELGLIMGTGIITTLLAVLLLLPTLLFLRASRVSPRESQRMGFIGTVAEWAQNHKALVLPVTVLLIAISLWQGTKVTFLLNIQDLEPKGLESVKVMNQISDKFGFSNDGLMFTSSSLEEVYTLTEELRDQPRIEEVSSITDYIPPLSVQEQRLTAIQKINALIDQQPNYQQIDWAELKSELERLEANIFEIGQLAFMSGNDTVVSAADEITQGPLPRLLEVLETKKDSEVITEFTRQFYQVLQEKTSLMKVRETLDLADLPPSITDQFVSSDSGSYLTTIYPKGNIWKEIKEPAGERFIYSTREIVPNATGIPLFMRVIYDETSKEIGTSILLVASALLALLYIHFRSIKESLVAFIPLVTSLALTLGLIKILGLGVDMVSILAFPLIIGIGIDDGVHVIHRLNISKSDFQTAYSSVGRAILLTTLTTMASFGSLMVADYQGIYRLGLTLFIGVGLCFIMTILLIPAFLKYNVRLSKEDSLCTKSLH